MSYSPLSIPISKLNDMTILLVESNILLQKEKELVLQPLCKQLFVAQNGLEGLVYFVEHHIDMIITAVDMPVMGGNEMIERIRSIDKNVPVALSHDLHTSHVTLQSSVNTRLRRISRKMGINLSTLIKPYRKPAILQIA